LHQQYVRATFSTLKGDVMGRLILFERGEVGGLFVGSHGVRAIPPFAPPVLAHLRAVSDLLRASHGQSDQTSHEMGRLVTQIANLAIERVEAAIGPLDANDSLVYLTDDDGFVCGSTGAPPRPIGWPPLGGGDLPDPVEGGLLAPDLLELIRRAPNRGVEILAILEDPAAVAKTIHVKLSDSSAATLRQLAPSRVASLPNPVDREMVGFLHEVMKDGRFIQTWSSQPVAAANAIGVKLSDAVVDKILGSSAIVGRVGDTANLSIEQGIVVGVVAILVLADQDPRVRNVIDRSQREKF
jgi:hypothetical protein